MSSIAAALYFGQPGPAEQLQAMADAGRCLGPSGITLWQLGSVGLAHGLFDVIPGESQEPLPTIASTVSTAHQDDPERRTGTLHVLRAFTLSHNVRQPVPVFGQPDSLSQDASSTLAVTADLRLDNRNEILSQLTARGQHLPDTVSDARIVLCGYREWGLELFGKLVGDFALALWDGPGRRLVLARDALGRRTLCFHANPTRFLAASSLRQLFVDPGTPTNFDEHTIARFLSAHPADQQATFFCGVQRLPAGEWLEIRHDGRMRRGRHWDVRSIRIESHRDIDSYAEQFGTLFTDSLKGRLRAKATAIGLHLSGGFDSSAIVAGVHHLGPDLPGSRTFVAFSNLGDRPEADERRYIEAVLSRYPMPQQTIPAAEFWVFRPVALAGWRDEPYLPVYLAQLVHELRAARSLGIDVMLAGSGGDEIGGNSWYLIDLLLRGKWWRFLPELRGRAAGRRTTMRGLLLSLANAVASSWIRRASGSRLAPAPWLAPSFARRQHLSRRERTARCFANPARQDTFERLQYCWTEPGLASANVLYGIHGVELRHPFFDRRLFEWALAIPPFLCGERGRVKAPMRRALNDILPVEVAHRNDKGNYLYYWDLGIRHRERTRIEQLLKKPLVAELGYVDPARLLQAYGRYCRGGQIHRRQFWNLLALETWLREREVAA